MLQLRPGNVRAQCHGNQHKIAPFLLLCSIGCLPHGCSRRPSDKRACDSPVTKGAFHGSCSGRVGTGGLSGGSSGLSGHSRPGCTWNRPSPETNPLRDCRRELTQQQRTEVIQKALISLTRKSYFLLEERLPVDGQTYGVSRFGRI